MASRRLIPSLSLSWPISKSPMRLTSPPQGRSAAALMNLAYVPCEASGLRSSGRTLGRPRPLADEAPQHQEDAERLKDGEEQQEGPNSPHRRTSKEDRIERDLQGEERPKLRHPRIGGSVEWEPALAPADGEHDRREQLKPGTDLERTRHTP